MVCIAGCEPVGTGSEPVDHPRFSLRNSRKREAALVKRTARRESGAQRQAVEVLQAERSPGTGEVRGALPRDGTIIAVRGVRGSAAAF